MNRRGFLSTCLALGVAPYVVKAEALMRVRQLRPIYVWDVYCDETITEFKRIIQPAVGTQRIVETWYEDASGFLLPTGRLDERGEYRGTAKLWAPR